MDCCNDVAMPLARVSIANTTPVAEQSRFVSSHTYSHRPTYCYLLFHHPLTLSFQAQNLSSLQIFPTVALPFFLLKYLLHGFPGLFTVISGHICFLLFVFFLLFLHFLVVGSVR